MQVRYELGTIFGYDPQSRAVNISGEIDAVEVGIANFETIIFCSYNFISF